MIKCSVREDDETSTRWRQVLSETEENPLQIPYDAGNFSDASFSIISSE